MRTALICAAVLACATSAQATDLGQIAGQWAQSSSGKELVLQSRIKLQPSASVGFGTSLGGSAGFGSMTKTTVVTEAVPGHVDRKMDLRLSPDGSFIWTTVKTEPVDSSCTRTVRQEKRGKAKLASGSLVFDISGGSESFEKSCGGTGRTALSASREAYKLTMDKGRMVLADGASRWTFSRN